MNRPWFVLIFLILVHFTVTTVNGEEGLESKKKELQSIYTKLEEQRKKLNSTKIKEKNVLLEITKLQSQIKKSQVRLSYSKYQLQKRSDEFKEITRQLHNSENKLNLLLHDFSDRIKEIYKNNQANWLDMFLASADYSDVFLNTVYFEKLVKEDIILIDTINEEMENFKKNREQALLKKKEIETQTTLIKREKNKLVENKNTKENLKKILELKRLQYEREIEELEKNSRQIEQMIKDLQAQSGKIVSTGTYIWPVNGWISSKYGYRTHPIFKTVKFHSGLDIAEPRGRPIKASDSGKIIFSGRWGGYGKTVIIDHGKGYSTVYAHQSRIYVKEGQIVEQGQTIGLVGSTGYSTGPHLHFEIRHNGKTIDPLRYLPKR